MYITGFFLGHQPAPKSWHGDLVLVRNAGPQLMLVSLALITHPISLHVHFAPGLFTLHSVHPTPCLAGGCLADPGSLPLLLLHSFLSFSYSHLLLVFICPSALPSPPWPSYWPFSLGRQSNTSLYT